MATAHSEFARKESPRKVLLQLPKYKPHEAEHFSVGHDVPEFQYGQTLKETTKDAKVVSFLFCGIADARNFFTAMSFYSMQGPKSEQRLHCTVLDHKPVVLEWDLAFFAILAELSQNGHSIHTMGGISSEQRAQFKETVSVFAYLFATQLMSAYVWERLQKTMRRLLDSFKHEQPIAWVYLPLTGQEDVCRTLSFWQPVPSPVFFATRHGGNQSSISYPNISICTIVALYGHTST